MGRRRSVPLPPMPNPSPQDPRIVALPAAEIRRRFIEFFTELMVFHVDNPNLTLLPKLFESGSLEDRVSFASQIGFFIRHMTEKTRQDVWRRWLHPYWENRLQSVPVPLDEAEIKAMLEWLPHLGELFPQGVALAVSARPVRIEHNHIPFVMRESDLVTRFPTETAKLLIGSCHCRALAQLVPRFGSPYRAKRRDARPTSSSKYK